MATKQYTRFSQEEFEEFLSEHADWSVVDTTGEITREKVYAINLPKEGLEVRIFSTLEGDSNRGCGEDAIRTVIWDTERNVIVGGRRSTYRIQTWRKNLLKKVQELMLEWSNIGKNCPSCGGWMEVREGKYGKFYGCKSYPQCSHTEQLDEDDE